MNEYQWYHDPLPISSPRSYSEKKKKAFPVWAAALITSVITSAAFITVFAVFILPNLRTPTTIHYSGSADSQPLPGTSNSAVTGNIQIAQIAQKCSPSTVYISSTGVIGGFFNQQVSLGNGSGVIVSDDGYIITSSSVVNSGTEIKVTLNDGQEVPAMLVGSDQKTDIAVLKVDVNGLTPAVLGNSSTLNIGDPIIAIGNPLGPKITNTVSYGIISGINNNVSLQKGSNMNLLQTDANISSGNAGGALFNAQGEVIGIVIANISSESGISFSVPVNDVKPLLSSFLNTGSAESSGGDTPMIGITGSEESYGVVVETISENYPAAKAGMKIGDVIIKVDGTPVTTVAKINEIRMSHQRGDTINFTIYRDGETLELPVTLE